MRGDGSDAKKKINVQENQMNFSAQQRTSNDILPKTKE
jgi:hypothetical protein